MKTIACQLPGFDDSDDKIFVTDHAIVMLDGASAFVPVPVPPAVYAHELGRRLSQRLEEAPDHDLAGILAHAIHDVATDLSLERGRSPSSTVTILREHAGTIDILILGDNLVALPGTTLTDDRLSRLDLAPSRHYRHRLARGAGFDETHRETLRQLQSQQAARRNQEGGYWIAEADPAAAQHAVTSRFPVGDVPWAVLATDGAYKPMQYLGLADWPMLAGSEKADLERVLHQCEVWEAFTDPIAAQLPRAKRHDDKSLAVVHR
ncbi:hypothetical protein QRX50_46790 [Amycolatopsis carbonis]|uniref:Protein phosphatase 2C-like protein n=1 Tax=Amycolatopsis carbonis TaxID=715471 RepID=A0A9Y2MUD1_9PSEU|nr:hypothetical protein [Amycolatopsis sp. 2-15]WIX78761.1 hypothetical protein QRX50_46790 [Amycolatopsis sp. 2-15]